jgi:hypothetical protein
VGDTTLTEFCREQKIGVVEQVPAGGYHFDPGAEMQHDTSPHRVNFGGVERLVQMASVAPAYSRMIFTQAYPAFTRFHYKTFLTEALRAFGGATVTSMVDDTHGVVDHGTGPIAVMAPEVRREGTGREGSSVPGAGRRPCLSRRERSQAGEPCRRKPASERTPPRSVSVMGGERKASRREGSHPG